MTNIRLKGGKEIDLLAINPKTLEKYHVESRVATSPSFKLRLQDTYTSKGKAHRRGIDFFAKEKFNHPTVRKFVEDIFEGSDYRKWLVVCSVQDADVIEQAEEKFGIEVTSISLLLGRMIRERKTRGSRDDVLRVVELMALSQKGKDMTNVREFMLRKLKERIRKSKLDRKEISRMLTILEEED